MKKKHNNHGVHANPTPSETPKVPFMLQRSPEDALNSKPSDNLASEEVRPEALGGAVPAL